MDDRTKHDGWQIQRLRISMCLRLLQRAGRWLCAVAKTLDGEGFLIATYPTDAIKDGAMMWPR